MNHGGEGSDETKVPGRAYLRKKATYRRPTAKGSDPGDPTTPSAPSARRTSPRTPRSPKRRTAATPAKTPSRGTPGTEGARRAEVTSTTTLSRRTSRILTWGTVVLAFGVAGGYVAVTGPLSTPLEPTAIVRSDATPRGVVGDPVSPEVKAMTDRAFGAFAPVEYAGSGTKRIALPDGVRGAFLTAEGDPWMVSWHALDQEGEQVAYGVQRTGREPGILIARERVIAAEVSIEGEGDWRVQVWPLSALGALPTGASGRDYGDEDCYLYGGSGGSATFTYEGGTSFSVEEYDPSGRHYLLSVNGPAEATRTLAPGPSVLCIRTNEGSWSIKGP